VRLRRAKPCGYSSSTRPLSRHAGFFRIAAATAAAIATTAYKIRLDVGRQNIASAATEKYSI